MTEPRATYRVQLTPEFGFDEAGGIAAYLAELGVSHLYASPYLQAAPGSTHGYDVVDHSRVNQELGGERWHRQMCDSLRDHGLAQLLDVVPNHMAISAGNAWWWDVLENGPSSVYASHFDIDWDPPEAKLRDTVLIPVLEDHYGRVLEARKIRLEREEGSFVVRYADHRFPLAPPTYDAVLDRATARHPHPEIESITAALRRLPPSTATDPASVRERHRDKEVLRDRLAELVAGDPSLMDALDQAVADINHDIDALDQLLERQNYRLAHWRTAQHELDYRRFFSINTLVGLRVEHGPVFDETHQLVLGMVRDGDVSGLRIDHPDGLRDPEGYLRRLRDATDGAWVVVEKILEPEEQLRATWPVGGTVGYEFLNRVNGLFVDPAAEPAFNHLYAEVTGEPTDWAQIALAKKHLVMQSELAADLARLTHLFVAVCERHRRYRDYTRRDLRDALEEVIASFPVYRTYVDAAAGRATDEDVACVSAAVEDAGRRRADLDPDLLTFLRDVLLGRSPDPAARELAGRFQQVTGAVMAKGVEDTAFYTYNRFIALNEVGGDPSRFGVSVEEFHRANQHAQASWPGTLLSTSTHDTKRSEDVRARLCALSEIPGEWAEAVQSWMVLAERHRRGGMPDANSTYVLFQTLVGAWPLPADRALAYMEKATREAKVHTSWTNPDESFDTALRQFVHGVLGDDDLVGRIATFTDTIVTAGRVNSLAQTLLKLTSPGVPDIYQGTELWDLSLVDPDNRRPVDYARCRLLLGEADAMTAAEAWGRAYEGLPKLHLIRRALRLRRDEPEVFGASSSYRPVAAAGARRDHVVAFLRGERVMTVVPRLTARMKGWENTSVPLAPGPWHNALTDERVEGGGAIPISQLFERFPVALLVHR